MKNYDVRKIDRTTLLQLLKEGVELTCPVCNQKLEYYPKDILNADYLLSLACPINNFHYGFFSDDANKIEKIRESMRRMAIETEKTFSAEKLTKLINHLIANNNHEKVFELLNIATEKFPNNSQFHYLLGLEYALNSEYKKAIRAMKTAIALDPDLHIAVFVSGLLYLVQGQPDEAIEIWDFLAYLPECTSLYQFSLGLQYLLKGELELSKVMLVEGIEHNKDNPLLAAEMQKIVDRITTQKINSSIDTTKIVTVLFQSHNQQIWKI